MNKKLLLLALPALMVVSSCTYMEHATKVDLFKEDTVANEQLFGELLPNRLGVPDVDPGDDPTWTKAPKVGNNFWSFFSRHYFAPRPRTTTQNVLNKIFD